MMIRVPDNKNAHALTLMRAAQIVGGVAELSVYLGVSQLDLMRWIRGEDEPPAKAFLDTVSLLLDHDLGKWSPEPPEWPR